MPNDIAESIPAGPTTPQFAPSTKGVSSYWFDDGSVIARLRDHNFKVHKSLLDRDSPYVASLPTTNMEGHTVPVLRIPDGRASIEDFTALLGHLYHNMYVILEYPLYLNVYLIFSRCLYDSIMCKTLRSRLAVHPCCASASSDL